MAEQVADPLPRHHDRRAGVSPFFGGVQMYWTAEAQTRTETEPQFKQMELKAWELSGYCVSTNVLLQDSIIGLEKFLMTLFAKSIAWFEEYAFLQGNGAGKPQGMLTAGATLDEDAQHRQSGQLRRWPPCGRSCCRRRGARPSGCSRRAWCRSCCSSRTANRAIFISIDQGATKSPNWTLLGRPAFPTEKVPALGTKGDLMLLDPSLYVVGDRMQIEIAASEHVNFLKNQMTWRVVGASMGAVVQRLESPLQEAAQFPFVAY